MQLNVPSDRNTTRNAVSVHDLITNMSLFLTLSHPFRLCFHPEKRFNALKRISTNSFQ